MTRDVNFVKNLFTSSLSSSTDSGRRAGDQCGVMIVVGIKCQFLNVCIGFNVIWPKEVRATYIAFLLQVASHLDGGRFFTFFAIATRFTTAV